MCLIEYFIYVLFWKKCDPGPWSQTLHVCEKIRRYHGKGVKIQKLQPQYDCCLGPILYYLSFNTIGIAGLSSPLNCVIIFIYILKEPINLICEDFVKIVILFFSWYRQIRV